MDADVLALQDGIHNGSSQELNPAQTEPQVVLATKGGSNCSPQLITIQSSLEITQPQIGPPSKIGVQGHLDWGINGCSHVVQFDWLQGVQFTLAATSFKLRAILRSTISPGTKVMAKASVAYGTKAAVPLQLTSEYKTLFAAASITLDIPPWATHGLLVGSPFFLLSTGSVLLELLTYDNVARYEVRPTDCTESNRFPLSCDVQKVKVTNFSDTKLNFALIWRLSL
jgi:hypothetical protein